MLRGFPKVGRFVRCLVPFVVSGWERICLCSTYLVAILAPIDIGGWERFSRRSTHFVVILVPFDVSG